MYYGFNNIKIGYTKNGIIYKFIILIIIKQISTQYEISWILEQNINIIYKIFTKIIENFNYENSLYKLKLYYNKSDSYDIYKYLFYNIVNKNIIKYSVKNESFLNISSIVINYKLKKYLVFFKPDNIKIIKNKKIIVYSLVISLDEITKKKLKKYMHKKISKKYTICKTINTENFVYYFIK